MAAQDEVRLAMPADPEFLRLARVTAMGLASRLGFTFDEIEDLRIAIDELCFSLIGTRGRPGSIELHYRALQDGLEVRGEGHFDGDPGPAHGLTELSELIIAAVTDEHAMDPEQMTFRLVKKHDRS